MPSFPKLSTSLEQGRPHSRLRLLGLLAVVVLTVLLPLAGASAGPVGDTSAEDRLNSGGLRADTADTADTTDTTDTADKADPADQPSNTGNGNNNGNNKHHDGKNSNGNTRSSGTGTSSLLAGLGVATTARCGPELASPGGIEAQTCVLTQGRDTWARTYYRNATGGRLSSVLTLMAPAGRTVQMHCAVGAQDEPGTCDTPRQRTSGEASAYSAVAEFAGVGDEGPLLLRSGSNGAPAGR